MSVRAESGANAEAVDLFFFDPARLDPLAKANRDSYDRPPFPHAVIDGLLPTETAKRVADAFPGPDHPGFRRPDSGNVQQGKLGKFKPGKLTALPPFLRHLLNEFGSAAFLDFLEELTGLEGLIPDPHLRGGGFHQVLPGGHLSIHADFNIDSRRRLARRLNVLLYLNDDWPEEYGGHLELWDQDMSQCRVRVAPILNRCVIFNTTATSYHGHPDPLSCPPERTRRSLAFYYYSALSPEEIGAEAHSTLWQSRPGEAARASGA